MKQAERAYRAGENDKAMALAKELYEGKGPLADYGLFFMAEIQLKKGMNQQAAESFTKLATEFQESRFKDYAEGKVAQFSIPPAD